MIYRLHLTEVPFLLVLLYFVCIDFYVQQSCEVSSTRLGSHSNLKVIELQPEAVIKNST